MAAYSHGVTGRGGLSSGQMSQLTHLCQQALAGGL